MRFEKITYAEWSLAMKTFIPDIEEKDIKISYDNIKLPQASTTCAAGHDFFLPFEVHFVPEVEQLIPTGIRWVTEDSDPNVFMMICPRSSLGTKYGMELTNTIGIIDGDYYMAKNEGHIMAKISCKEPFILKQNDKFMQGIIMPYWRCGSEATNKRTGGFGSTDT